MGEVDLKAGMQFSCWVVSGNGSVTWLPLTGNMAVRMVLQSCSSVCCQICSSSLYHLLILVPKNCSPLPSNMKIIWLTSNMLFLFLPVDMCYFYFIRSEYSSWAAFAFILWLFFSLLHCFCIFDWVKVLAILQCCSCLIFDKSRLRKVTLSSSVCWMLKIIRKK